jgi:hypothetical protein
MFATVDYYSSLRYPHPAALTIPWIHVPDSNNNGIREVHVRVLYTYKSCIVRSSSSHRSNEAIPKAYTWRSKDFFNPGIEYAMADMVESLWSTKMEP